LTGSDSSELVLDASAFYAGIPFQSSRKCYSTKAVYEEVKHIRQAYAVLDALIDSGNLTILEPEESSLSRVIDTAKMTGDIQELSIADISIIALALQLKKTLISDDYAIGNISAFLKIPIKTIAFRGIGKLRKWIGFCNACGRAYKPYTRICTVCGSRVMRRFKDIREIR
jgi:UPF0271 protein